jgi:protein arginine kinase activator
MLCDVCKKNEATVHIKEIHEGKVISRNLCAQCAQKQELGLPKLGGVGLNIAEFLVNLGKLDAAALEGIKSGNIIPEELAKHFQLNAKAPEIKNGPVCSHCQWDLNKMRSSHGRLGCPKCYDTFKDMLEDILEQIQRGSIHEGRRPVANSNDGIGSLKLELEKLNQEIVQCIQAEEYEKAAILRDKIATTKAAIEKLENSISQ